MLPNLLSSLFLGYFAVGGNGIPNLIRDTGSGSSTSEDNHSHVFEFQFAHVEGGYHCG
jgi:hypothetical protein